MFLQIAISPGPVQVLSSTLRVAFGVQYPLTRNTCHRKTYTRPSLQLDLLELSAGSTSASHSHFGTWFAVCIGVTLAAGILAAAAIKLLTIRRAKRQQEVLPLVQETEMTLL